MTTKQFLLYFFTNCLKYRPQIAEVKRFTFSLKHDNRFIYLFIYFFKYVCLLHNNATFSGTIYTDSEFFIKVENIKPNRISPLVFIEVHVVLSFVSPYFLL